jgi:hypothetical protein
MLEQFTGSAQKPATRCARERAISRPSVQRTLKRAKWKVYIPHLLQAMNEDDPDRRVQFCDWSQHKAHEDMELVRKIAWPDEVTYKVNGRVTRHNCVHYYYYYYFYYGSTVLCWAMAAFSVS